MSKSIAEGDLAALLEYGSRKRAKKAAARERVDDGFSQATAYRALDPEGRFAGRLSEEDGLLVWR